MYCWADRLNSSYMIISRYCDCSQVTIVLNPSVLATHTACISLLLSVIPYLSLHSQRCTTLISHGEGGRGRSERMGGHTLQHPSLLLSSAHQTVILLPAPA